MTSASRWPAVALATVLVASIAPAALAVLPYPGPASPEGAYDYASYLFIGSGDCSGGSNDLPASFSCAGDWKFTDHRQEPAPVETFDPGVYANPQEFYGVKGVGLNRAWEITTGRPDTVIAVMDSGIRWEENRDNLLKKHYLNRGELPVPQGGPNAGDERFDGYDVNADGIFNVVDYWADGRVADLNGNGDIDPEDLIRTFSDGTDADGNGYVDDISGWDFLENDNNPQDDVDYGHGTGEMADSVEEAGFGDGQCPNCMAMSLRVGDSFIADVNHWAEAVVYAVDNEASVIQEALGTLNHTSFGQAAADYAYANGVIINASEADEAAGHHNWPAAYDHTMVVNSIRTPTLGTTRPYSYLYFNGCTNFGGYTYVSIPSTSCSSEATGRSAGVSGLLYSAARNAIERGDMTPYVRDDGTLAPFPLSAEEAMQLWRLSADDIDFSSPCPQHAFCDDVPAETAPVAPPNNYGTTLADSIRYQTVRGWDYFTGYGRSNAARLVRYVGIEGADGVDDREYTDGPYGVGPSELSAQDRIPPESDITWPRRWHQYGYADGRLVLPDDPAAPQEIVIRGRAAANRVTAEGGTFDYVLEYAPQVQGQKHPVGSLQPAAGSEETSGGPWTTIRTVTGRTEPVEGELGRVNVNTLAGAISGSIPAFTPADDPTSEFQPERFAIRLRLRVIAHPVDAADTINNEAVIQKQIDVYPAGEAVIRDDLGVRRTDLGGVAEMDRLNGDGLGRYAGGAGSPSFHDLDGDGTDELLLPTSDGVIHAFTDVATGEELPGWPVTTDPYPGIRRRGVNGYTTGAVTDEVYGSVLLGTLAAADLDDDGNLEVSIGDLEGSLYVWEHDGSRRAGFPVAVDLVLSREVPCGPSTIPDCDDYEPGGGVRDFFNTRDWGINSAPAIGDLDPGTPGLEIVVGSNDAHVYAWHADGTPVEGWPVVLRDPATVATMDPETRVFTYEDGSGADKDSKVLVSPALGDIDGDGSLEVVIGVNEQYVEEPNASIEDPVITALNESDQVDSGNTRVYALHHDGAAHPASSVHQDTPHTQDQAYVDGWPVPIALLLIDLLPYVAAGPNTQAVLYQADDEPGLEIAISPADGPAYLLNHDGSSFLGEVDDKYRTLATRPDQFGAASTATDGSSFVAVGGLAAGSLDDGGHVSVAGPGAGVKRLLDVVLEAKQVGAEDHLLIWNAEVPTGSFEPNAPIVVNDLQFFTTPIVADVTGDGLAEVIQGTAMSDTVAAGLAHTSATAIRHFTGGWHVGSASVGTLPGDPDAPLHLATVTREGYLRLFPTGVPSGGPAACTATSQWPEYGHDARNTGNYLTDAERPSPVRDFEAAEGPPGRAELRFAATGDDRTCGAASRYEIRLADGHGEPRWEAGTVVEVEPDPEPEPEGAPMQVTIPVSGAPQTVMVRAFDDVGNGSAVVSAAVGSAPTPDAGCPGVEGLPENHIVGTSGPDILMGTPGPDVICAKAGDDVIKGKGGADLVFGGPGKDRILGGAGFDAFHGGPGRDLLVGRRGTDILVGGGGPDRLRGGAGDDLLAGRRGRDRLWGGTGDDGLFAGKGRDRCRAGPGEDTLRGCERGPRRR